MSFSSAMRHVLLAIVFVTSLSGCDLIASLTGQGNAQQDEEKHPTAQLTFAVAPHIAWMPWYLAKEESIFDQYTAMHQIEVQFIKDNYRDTINKFISKEYHAIAISNIDAIAQLVRRKIPADVILITNDHNGSEAILVPNTADTTGHNFRGKTFAFLQYSARHYLFDRYLIRNQISFDEINILNTAEEDIRNVFLDEKVYGVVTHNPNLYELTQSAAAKRLFDSRQIPKEIFDFIIVQRETLTKYPAFAQVILATWFTVMQKLQGSKKETTLDALAGLAELTRQKYDEQLATTLLNDTSTKALAAIRDRRIRKAMRHIRYFIQRHKLVDDDNTDWVSYPGRVPALLHFNGKPLQKFIEPTVANQT
jgi:NitT/TauT family transport system substrate-binding protein